MVYGDCVLFAERAYELFYMARLTRLARGSRSESES